MLARFLRPKTTVSAHCDLPCGIYDPAQARIEAESVKAIVEKYESNEDPVFRARALIIKEQRSELVKHHLWVLWTDYFKPPHFEKYPQLHQLFNEATKLAGASRHEGRRRRRQGRRPPGQDRRDRQDLLGDQERLSSLPGEGRSAHPADAALAMRAPGGCGPYRRATARTGLAPRPAPGPAPPPRVPHLAACGAPPMSCCGHHDPAGPGRGSGDSAPTGVRRHNRATASGDTAPGKDPLAISRRAGRASRCALAVVSRKRPTPARE